MERTTFNVRVESVRDEAHGVRSFSVARLDGQSFDRYEPGARLSLHQDRNEMDFTQPVVTVSLGLPAMFQWGGGARADRTTSVRLEHGDVMVWGGPDRLNFHGVDTMREGDRRTATRHWLAPSSPRQYRS